MATKEGVFESPVTPNAHVQNPTKPGLLVNPYFDDFYRTHKKAMWDFDKVPFDRINPKLLTDDDIEAATTAMEVESHNPVYTARLLTYFREDHEMTSFIMTWGYEEMKHYLGLRTYLEASGRVNLGTLAANLTQVRSGPWGDREAGFTEGQSYGYTMVQEQVTGRFYNKFADRTKEPVLRDMLRLIGKDEYRHAAYYLEKGKQEVKKNPDAREQISEVLMDFGMPGPTFMGEDNYREGAEVMDRIASPGPLDMVAVLRKVGEMIGYRYLFDLLDNKEHQKALREHWRIDIEQVMNMLRPMRAAANILG